MEEQTKIDVAELICEVARYLAVVDVFRAEQCEPRWLPECLPAPDMCIGAAGRGRRCRYSLGR